MGKLRTLALSALAVRVWRRGRETPAAPGAARPNDYRDLTRGRQARQPREIPAGGWKDILLRVKEETAKDNLSIVAAGVAFYGLMAIVPAIAAAVSIYGLFVSPSLFQEHFSNIAGFLPPQARDILLQQMQRITASADTALGWAAALSIFVALASAMKGSSALIAATNIAYEEQETRGFIRLYLIAFALTVGGIVFAIVALTLVALLPVLVDLLPLPDAVGTAAKSLRWPLLAVLLMIALALLYRYAPDRRVAQWRWISWGAVIATLLWLAGSALFSLYVSNFGSYNETYGSLGAVVILLMWFWVSAYIVLLGAELNAETEHQTMRDSTVGPSRPLGEREAYVADTVGRGPGEDTKT